MGRFGAWIVVLAVLAWVVGWLGPDAATTGVQIIRDVARGADGPVRQGMVYAAAAGFTFATVFLPLPAEASALLNGTLFPSGIAFGLTWSVGMLAAAASYEIGKRAGRGPAQRLFGTDRLARMERLIERAGWPTLLALRLSPVMAFTAINWASGILALSRPVFYWTTAAGLVPGTYVFTIVPGVLTASGSTRLVVLAALLAMLLLLTVSAGRVWRSRPGSP